MKKIFSLLILVILFQCIFAYKIIDLNYGKLYIEENNGLEDFISIIIDRGTVNEKYINNIIYTLDYNLKNYYKIFTYNMLPDYTILNFYLESGNSEYFLLKFRQILNSPIIYKNDLYDLDIINRSLLLCLGENLSNYKTNDRLTKHIISNNMYFLISTSNNKKNIINILSSMQFNKKSNNMEINIPINEKIQNQYIRDNIYIYNIKNYKNFYFPEYVLYEYLIRFRGGYANITSAENRMYFIGVQHNIDTLTIEEFNEIKKMFVANYVSSKKSIQYLLNNFDYFVYSDNIKYLTGIYNKIIKMKYEKFLYFLKTIKPFFSLINEEKENKYKNVEKRILDNGITLLYYPVKSENTEISILLKNILSIENYYSKPFAAELIMNEIVRENNKWQKVQLSLFANYEIFYANFNNMLFEYEYSKFVNNIKNINFNNIRNEKFIDTLIHEINTYNFILPELEKSYCENRINGNKDVLYLSNGEFQILTKKMFSNDNLIIAVKTSIPIDSIVNIIDESFFINSIVDYKIRTFSLNSMSGKDYILGSNYSNKDLKFMFLSFLNYPYANIINKEFYYTNYNYSYYKNEINERLYFYNIMQNNAITIFMLISDFIKNDPNYIFNIIN